MGLGLGLGLGFGLGSGVRVRVWSGVVAAVLAPLDGDGARLAVELVREVAGVRGAVEVAVGTQLDAEPVAGVISR